MKWTPIALASVGLISGVSAPLIAHAKIYLSIEQAQKIMFGHTSWNHKPILISDDIQKKMRQASGVSHPFNSHRIWKSTQGAWFIVDEVVGKHEMITYALGIEADGRIKNIEILEYRESYGYEVGEDSWRKQFMGKTSKSNLKLNKDIQNISGATLSAKHLTDGVKRLMIMHELALQGN